MFEEYGLLLKKLGCDSCKNNLVRNKNRLKVDDGWTNHRLFGSLSDNEICERNIRQSIQVYDNI